MANQRVRIFVDVTEVLLPWTDVSANLTEFMFPADAKILGIRVKANTTLGPGTLLLSSDHVWSSITKFDWRCEDEKAVKWGVWFDWKWVDFDDSNWTLPVETPALPSQTSSPGLATWIWHDSEKSSILCRAHLGTSDH